GRRIGGATTGNVDADAFERANLLAQHRTVLVGHAPRFGHRGRVIPFDAVGGVLERHPNLGGNHPLGRLEVRGGEGEIPGGGGAPAVESRRVLAERRVAAGADGDEGLVAGSMGLGRDRLPRPGQGRPDVVRPTPRLRGAEQGSGTRWRRTEPFISLMSSLTAACSVRIEARFTISRAVDRAISATSTSPLTLRVSPDWTRSTMRSARPTSGANSIEPSTRTSSTWMPRSVKYCSAMRGYFVATRTHDHFAGSSRSHNSRSSATT